MELIDGKKVAAEVKQEIAAEVEQMIAEGKRRPHLVAILVGHDGGSETYVRNKVIACEQCGFKSTLIRYEDDVTENELLDTIDKLNNDADVDGFIVQLPLPRHISEQRIIEAIDYRKDVDGFHPTNVGRMSIGLPCFVSATPAGIIELLSRYNVNTNGANRVVPAIDPGEAAMLAGRLGHADVVLAGERDAVKLPDFDIGNSPSEYSANTVKDRSVIISTTNGTAAIHGMSAAKDVLIGGMINRSAVAKRAVELGNDIIIVCAGTYGQISADDLLAAGSIAEAINRLSPSGIDASDITMVCCMLYADWKQGRADLSVTKHCARLISLGFEEDIRYCFSEDITDVVPVYENGVIR